MTDVPEHFWDFMEDGDLPRFAEQERKMTLEQQVRQALARGYCHPANSHKEMDVDLVEAMTAEIVKCLTPEVTPGHR